MRKNQYKILLFIFLIFFKQNLFSYSNTALDKLKNQDKNLSGLDFRGATIKSKDLSVYNLTNANLQEAKLWDINFVNCNLTNINCKDAVFIRCKLTKEQKDSIFKSGGYISDFSIIGNADMHEIREFKEIK